MTQRSQCPDCGGTECPRWELTCGPVVKTRAFAATDPGLIPGWGTEIPQAMWCRKQKRQRGSSPLQEPHTEQCLVGGEVSDWQVCLSGCTTQASFL